MELDAVTPLRLVLERGDRRVARARGDAEARRRGEDAVAVTGPYTLALRRVGEQRRLRGYFDLRATVLALVRRLHPPVEKVGGELHAVTDAENGNAEIEDLARTGRRRLGVYRLRAAGKDDCLRREIADLVHGEIARMDDRVDFLVANPPRDELRVLRSEVENDDGFGLHHHAKPMERETKRTSGVIFLQTAPKSVMKLGLQMSFSSSLTEVTKSVRFRSSMNG